MKLSMKTPFHHHTHKGEGWFDDIRLDLIAAAVGPNHDINRGIEYVLIVNRES